MAMSPNDPQRNESTKDKDEGKLERLAQEIDPSGRKIDNRDLKDPGRMTPGATPTDNRS